MKPTGRIFVVLGVVLGVILTGYFFWNLDWVACASLLQSLSFPYLMGVALCIVASSLVRAVRWRILVCGQPGKFGLSPSHAAPQSVFIFWRAVCVGYLGNMIFPAKAGEGLRVLYLHSRAGVAAALALSTGLLDRLWDVLALAVVLVGLFIFAVESPLSVSLWWVFPCLGVFVTLMVFALARMPEKVRAVLALPIIIFPHAWQPRLGNLLDQAMGVAGVFRQPVVAFLLLGGSLLAIFLDCATCWLLIKAFSWELPATAALVMEAAFAIGGSLPSAPGYIGIYQAAAVLVLQQYGVEQSAAVLYALGMQIMVLLTFSLLGGSALLSIRRKRP